MTNPLSIMLGVIRVGVYLTDHIQCNNVIFTFIFITKLDSVIYYVLCEIFNSLFCKQYKISFYKIYNSFQIWVPIA